MVIYLKKHHEEEKEPNAERWLITYADLMNNLLIFFIMLYAMSATDLNKFKTFIYSFKDTFNTNDVTDISYGSDVNSILDTSVDFSGGDSSGADISGETSGQEGVGGDTSNSGNGDYTLTDLDEFIKKISVLIKENGYTDQITVEKVNEYVYFRFSEGVLFYPNQAVLKDGSSKALDLIGDIIVKTYSEISYIEIAGHTAWVPIDETTTDFSSWDLSAERSLTVLKFLVQECNLPKTKMAIIGYSSTHPYTDGTTEAEKALNRRVEIRISRLSDKNESDVSDTINGK